MIPKTTNTLSRARSVSGWPPHHRKPELIKVTDRVYSAFDYALSNVLYVITARSLVVIDTADSMSAAQAAFDDFRKVCQLPVSYIIYTHFHDDHIRGAKIFHTPATHVIAQKRLPEERGRINLLLPYKRRVNALQFGFSIPIKGRGGYVAGDLKNGYVPPDITFDEEYQFEEGGVSFELYHTEGETFDHLMVWLPRERILFPGDLFYSCFPMLSNPLKPDRPVLAWAESLERMRTLQPEYLVPSHSRPRRGAGDIDSVLANYARAIRHVHNETVKGINQGLSLEQIRRQVQLPQDLAGLPYLQERYGTVKWAVNGIFRQYTGWYSFNPTDLRPGPRPALHRALLEASGGAEPLIRCARRALNHSQEQLVLELTDIVLGARPSNHQGQALRRQALKRLGTRAKNGVERNIYLMAATRLAPRWVDLKNRSLEMQPASREEQAGAFSARSAEVGRVRQDSAAFTGQTGQERRTAAVNRWYDKRMYSPLVDEFYGGSDFHNYGYWQRDTRTPKEACENLMEHLLAFIPMKKGAILDVACGKGATTRHLLNYYLPEDVTGINISEKQVETCRVKAPGCKFLLMNATELAFEENCFDNIICVEAAMNFNTREKFLFEACRVLKPGGRLVLSDVLRKRPTAAEDLLIPARNYIKDQKEYRDIYLRAGFESLETIDATNECWVQFFTYCLHYLRSKLGNGEIKRPAFTWAVNNLRRRDSVIRSYILACARKPAVSQSSVEVR